MLDVVEDLRRTLGDEARRRVLREPVEDADFRRLVIARLDDEEGTGLRRVDLQEETLVGLFIDDRVFCAVLAEPMAPQAHGTMVVVEFDIVEAGGIAEPDDPAGGAGDLVGEIRTGCKIAHADRVVFRTLGVGAPGEKLVIEGMLGAAEIEKGVAFGFLVAVEHDRLAATTPVLARDEGMLPALAVAGEVCEGPVRLRHRGIVLLDARAHLGDEALLQVFGLGEGRGRVGILPFEMAADFARQARGILQHLFPVRRLEPGIVVANLGAVHGRHARLDRRERSIARRAKEESAFIHDTSLVLAGIVEEKAAATQVRRRIPMTPSGFAPS